MAQQPTTPTIDDVAISLSRAAHTIAEYLTGKLPTNRDGFFPTKLSGEEDSQSAAELTALFPLIHTLNQIRAIQIDKIALVLDGETN